MSLTETVTALFYVQVSVFVRSAVSTRDSTSGSLELKLPNPAIMSDATLILSSLVLSIYGAFLGAVFLLLFCPKIAVLQIRTESLSAENPPGIGRRKLVKLRITPRRRSAALHPDK